MQVDLGGKVVVPHESVSQRLVYFIELPWEDSVEEAYERKKLTEAEQRGSKVRVCPVEVGSRGFVESGLVPGGTGCMGTEFEERKCQMR